RSVTSCASQIRRGSRWRACACSCANAAPITTSSSCLAKSGEKTISGCSRPLVNTPHSGASRSSAQSARSAARANMSANGMHAASSTQLPNRSCTGSDSVRVQPTSQAATARAGRTGYHNRSHARRSSGCPLAEDKSIAGSQQRGCRASPPSKTISNESNNSRPTFGSPACRDRPFQLFKQLGINGIDRFDECGDSRLRCGPQQPRHAAACTCALDLFAGDARLIAKSVALALAPDQPFGTQSIDDLCGRGIRQIPRGARSLVQLPYRGAAQPPKLCQDGVLELIGGQAELQHDRHDPP